MTRAIVCAAVAAAAVSMAVPAQAMTADPGLKAASPATVQLARYYYQSRQRPYWWRHYDRAHRYLARARVAAPSLLLGAPLRLALPVRPGVFEDASRHRLGADIAAAEGCFHLAPHFHGRVVGVVGDVRPFKRATFGDIALELDVMG
jgi:hypothetical protein